LKSATSSTASSLSADTTRIDLSKVAIVLHRPRYPENIGAAARAMCNMGLDRLVVVSPERYEAEKALKLATHGARHIVDRMVMAEDLATALAAFSYVVGTTARLGGQRRVYRRPELLAEALIPISIDNSIAIVFGPEDRGLANVDIRLCHALVNIPAADFSSLNLAQAVMIICYELRRAAVAMPGEATPRLANRFELDAMYDQLRDVLVRISFISHDNPEYWMGRIRNFFTRMQLRARDVAILRGICRQIDWYGRKCYDDGREGRPKER
jgi:tRNA/rRNA methyltransferase